MAVGAIYLYNINEEKTQTHLDKIQEFLHSNQIYLAALQNTTYYSHHIQETK